MIIQSNNPSQAAPNPFKFTVFTATYNRAHTIDRVYKSLCSQTFGDFEWVIVDDGSSDGTPELVADWLKSAPFRLRYFSQANAGKHVAANRGVREAHGILFLNLDSDDSCVPTALERLWHHWDSIAPDERASYSGVTALCQDEEGHVIGDRFPADIVDASWLDVRFRNGVSGEKWGFQRTDVMRAHPFPEVAGMSYYPEDVIWDAIARRYKTRFVNEALRTYHTASSGLARNVDPARHAASSREGSLHNINHNADYFRYAPKAFLKASANYSRFCFHSGMRLKQQADQIQHAGGRLLWLAGLPVGYAAYRRDRAKHAPPDAS